MRAIVYTLFIIAALLTPSQKQPPKDPLKEMQRRAEKDSMEKNYKELKDAAAELAELSRQINADIEVGGEHVISARIFDRLDRIEKLTKRIRDRARGNSIVVRQEP